MDDGRFIVMAPTIPIQLQLMWPVLKAIRGLGGSANIAEISEQVAQQEGFSEEQMDILHKGSSQSEIDYRLAWARTHLKGIGAVANSSRGVWALTELGRTITEDEMELLYRERLKLQQSAGKPNRPAPTDDGDAEPGDDPDRWRDDLLQRLLEIPPDGFERLVQRLLREAGFRNVEVLGKSGDGGIDGVGVYRLSLVSFPTYFQCKRFRGSVPSGAVRDFRGAMSGRGEKGLLVTTGSFTSSARKEATRDGAPPVDLVSGYELCDLLKEYGLGVKVTERVIEEIEIDPGFFDQF